MSQSIKPLKKILLVDDEGIIQKLCQRLLKEFGCEVFSAGGIKEGIALMELALPDILISDLKLPDGDGMDLVRLYKSRFANGKAIIITGSTSLDERLRQASAAGVNEYILKPFELKEFASAVKRCID